MIKLTSSSCYIQELDKLNDFISFKLRTKSTTNLDKIKQVQNSTNVLPRSELDVYNQYEFDTKLLNIFNNNPPTNNGMYTNRVELLHGFSDYLVSNVKNFLKWFPVAFDSVTYQNLLYTVFKLLVKVDEQFLTDEETLNVYSVMRNNLTTQLIIDLPQYYNEDILSNETNKMNVELVNLGLNATIEFKLLDVSSNRYIVNLQNQQKFLEAISLGDVMRWSDFETGVTTLDMLDNSSMELPVVLGLNYNNEPVIVDLAKETSTLLINNYQSVIHSLTRLMLLNLVVMNHYRDLNIVLIDTNKSTYLKQFSNLPHVVTYETVIENLYKTLCDVEIEIERRKATIVDYDLDNFQQLRSELKCTGQQDMLDTFPYLTIVLDNLTSTLRDYQWAYKNMPSKVKHVEKLLETIAKDGRSLGIHLITSGQSVKADYLPKNLLTNSSLRICKKLDNEIDYQIIYGTNCSKYLDQLTVNTSYLRSSKSNKVEILKNAVLGGATSNQIDDLLKFICLHWIARSIK